MHKKLSNSYEIHIILANILLNTEGKLRAKLSMLCDGPVESHHLHMNIPEVIPWILMAHIRKAGGGSPNIDLVSWSADKK